MTIFEELRGISDAIVDTFSTRIDEIKTEYGDSLALADAIYRVQDLREVYSHISDTMKYLILLILNKFWDSCYLKCMRCYRRMPKV